MILENLLLPLLSKTENAAHHVQEVADTLAHAAGHGHEAGSEMPELPNILQMLHLAFGGFWDSAYHWENIIFGFVVLLFFCFIAMRVYKKRELIPGKLQNTVEIIVEGMDNFFYSILGHHARAYVPFLGTLFLYILFMNLMGLLPFFKYPTSSLNITLSLALVVFFYVQYTGIRRLGIMGYIDHLLGEPRDVMGWILVPLNLPIHILGELSKPVSLSLRLFGNITGEDVLIAAFTGLGIMMLSFIPTDFAFGIPLQLPFYFLALLTSTIQALVFTLLASVYFLMMLPHDEEEH